MYIVSMIMCDFWISPHFDVVRNNGQEAIVLYLYLRTNHHLNMTGVYPVSLETISAETNLSTVKITEILEIFSSNHLVSYDFNFNVFGCMMC